MRFAHLADCHIGGWRDPRLRDLSLKAFCHAVTRILEEKCDFVLIAGDLFHTSLPSFDSMRTAVQQLKRLKDKGVAVYAIPGSHDYSPSGKTMIDVFEDAGLLENVFKGEVTEGVLRLRWVVDPKTGAKITGIPGKRGMLDRAWYKALDGGALELEEGYRILMVHTAITELMGDDAKQMDSMGIGELPKGLDYYAGGHIHIVREDRLGKGRIVYPGPLFPNNFRELEMLGRGGFYLVDGNDARFVPIEIIRTIPVMLDCTGLTPGGVEAELEQTIPDGDLTDAIVMIRLFGNLGKGRPSEIDMKGIISGLYRRGAYFVMRNINRLMAEEFQESEPDKRPVAELEAAMLDGIFPEVTGDGHQLMNTLSEQQEEGEKKQDFEKRIIDSSLKALGLSSIRRP